VSRSDTTIVYLCGTIELFIGLAFLAYAFWFAAERTA
jgi:hypothetical protein